MNTPIFVYVKEIDRMASAFDHADLAKDPKVLRHPGGGHAQPGRQGVDAQGPLPEEPHNPQASPHGQRLEDRRQPSCLRHNQSPVTF